MTPCHFSLNSLSLIPKERMTPPKIKWLPIQITHMPCNVHITDFITINCIVWKPTCTVTIILFPHSMYSTTLHWILTMGHGSSSVANWAQSLYWSGILQLDWWYMCALIYYIGLRFHADFQPGMILSSSHANFAPVCYLFIHDSYIPPIHPAYQC